MSRSTGPAMLGLLAIAFTLGAGMAVILFSVGGLQLALVGVIGAAFTLGAVAFARMGRSG